MARDTTHPGRIRIRPVRAPEPRGLAALAQDAVRTDILRALVTALRNQPDDPRGRYPAAPRRDLSGR